MVIAFKDRPSFEPAAADQLWSKFAKRAIMDMRYQYFAFTYAGFGIDS